MIALYCTCTDYELIGLFNGSGLLEASNITFDLSRALNRIPRKIYLLYR